MAQARYPGLFQINTRVWLTELGRDLRRPATLEEVMEVLKLCVVQGVQACNLGVPILAEAIAAGSATEARP